MMNKRILKLIAIGFLSPALFQMSNPKSAQAENQFDVCLQEIVKSNVSIELADTACADALIPKDLSYCVQKISNNTQITGEMALKNCYLVRRPVDMANCVVDIDKTILISSANKTNVPQESTMEATENDEDIDNTLFPEETMEMKESSIMENGEVSPLMLALETCTSTVLPVRHSECVIALSRTPEKMSPIKAMENCISAEDFPRDLFSDN